ncbi:hypothetical protein [Nonomuraea jabiensis]|uniref:Amidohydrolase-related domain-containing protein n=1 Tax=Nonomuraea jabiensis TaxID=882448 RepID=A0A7W9LI52_9ACTN|nr:hypothetical protein [Nonomuraea jabiensis]MBB5784706.1 hypothetical protein [Nonomuraea jabiensis]
MSVPGGHVGPGPIGEVLRGHPALLDLGISGKVVLGSDFPTILGLGAWSRAVCWGNGAAMI